MRLLISKTKTCAFLATIIWIVPVISVVSAETQNASAVWKTAFFKRGQMGGFQAAWGGGQGSTMRTALPLAVSGAKVRVWISSAQSESFQLMKCSLAKGADRNGVIEGRSYPVTFAGQASVEIPSKQVDLVSDEVRIPISTGVWYVQQTYESPTLTWAFDVDGFYWSAGDQHESGSLQNFKKGQLPGGVYRLDVLTHDPRSSVVCYGDSITQGFGATPETGNRYPEILAGVLDCLTLNLGVNGDMALYSGGGPAMIKKLEGVGAVIFLMGTNDIINGKVDSTDTFLKRIASFGNELTSTGIKFYVGTIPPAGGYAKFDADPEKEAMRQTINQGIRSGVAGGQMIDFDQALRDPADPVRMKADYQIDWLHPNDAGNRKMAEAAAAVLLPAR